MSLYRPPSVSEEPRIIICKWRVFELKNGDRHLVGEIFNNYDGRVSSRIIDYLDGVITTRSGRKYVLTGEAGTLSSQGNALYVFAHWCRYYKIDINDIKDVSQEYAAAPLSKIIEH